MNFLPLGYCIHTYRLILPSHSLMPINSSIEKEKKNKKLFTWRTHSSVQVMSPKKDVNSVSFLIFLTFSTPT